MAITRAQVRQQLRIVSKTPEGRERIRERYRDALQGRDGIAIADYSIMIETILNLEFNSCRAQNTNQAGTTRAATDNRVGKPR